MSTRSSHPFPRGYLNGTMRYAIGLMSGTSVDGIDAALVEIAGKPGSDELAVRLLAFRNRPFPEEVRDGIFRLFDPAAATVDRIGAMNVRLGELYAEAALAIAADAGIAPREVSVIGSHGQTIYHAPERGFTVQIGEGAVIAGRTGIPCVSDFRPADLAAGGQGAPLVPFTEYLLYREEKRTLLLQNIGGIGNLTVLPAGSGPDGVYAFDTGPGNMLIDGLMSRLTAGRMAMDRGGRMAAAGRVHAGLLNRLMADGYYRLPPPKSTGRERYGAACVEELLRLQGELKLSDEDLVATVTRLTAWSIGDAYRRFVRERHPADRLIVGGGGSYNPTLIGLLREEMAPVPVLTQEEIGANSDAKEAVAFALLADCALAGLPGSLPAVTGARHPAVLGKLSLPYNDGRGQP